MKVNPMRRAESTRVASMAAAVAVCFSLAGCFGGGGPPQKNVSDRVPVSGKVTFDGEPIEAGTVTYMNIETGNSAVCEIDGGYYESESDLGANPGKNTVMIVGKPSEDGDPMWNGSWTTQVDVGKTEFTEDFEITSQEVAPYDAASSRPVDTDD